MKLLTPQERRAVVGGTNDAGTGQSGRDKPK